MLLIKPLDRLGYRIFCWNETAGVIYAYGVVWLAVVIPLFVLFLVANYFL